MESIKHVDNFDLIKSLLNFDEPNSFYLVQILKRKKENPDLGVNARTINVYYIYSKRDLINLKDRIIYDCLHNNARAYINLNRLDTYLVALHAQQISIKYMIDGNFVAVKNAYATACGNLRSEDDDDETNDSKKFNVNNDDKKWLIDIDIINDKGEVDITQIELSDKVLSTIKELHAENTKKNYKILAKIPTKNGYHIITNPFNKIKFGKLYPGIAYQTNSPTILYV